MSDASEWAESMKALADRRPSFTTNVLDADGKQHEGEREVAFVIAAEGKARLQIRRGGPLDENGARHLALWLLATFAPDYYDALDAGLKTKAR